MKRIKKVSFISIKFKIVLICLIVVIAPIFVMIVNSYISSQQLLEQKYTELLMDIANQTNVRIDDYFKDIEKLSLAATFGMNSGMEATATDNYPLQNYLRDDRKENENVAAGMLMNYMLMKDQKISFYIYNLDGDKNLFVSSDLPYNYSYNVREEEWFKFFKASNSKMMTLTTYIDQQTQSKKHAMAHVRKILDEESGVVLGIMVVRIDLSVIDVVSSRLQKALQSRFTIVDESDTIIYNADLSLIGKTFDSIRPDGQRNIIVESSFERKRWKTYLYMPMSELSAEGDILRQNVFLLAILMLLLLVIISIYLSSIITQPMKKLMSNIIQVEKGKFDKVQDIHSRDEIGLLSNRFNRMSQELKSLVQKIQQEEKEKAAAEIRALQSQINPHFLYNTLGSVKWIASMQRVDSIVEITEALIAMLRYAARTEKTMVSVQEELNNLHSYMAIQQIRYYDRLRLDIVADEKLLNQPIPKLILQPIVENAIFHGFGEKEDIGIISIHVAKGSIDDDVFFIEVSDDGAGMDDETYTFVQRIMLGEENCSNSIGLYNVKRRIELHYDKKYGIEFDSSPGEGTSFKIYFPITVK